MNDESKWANLRKHPRISWNFVVKFKPKDSHDSEWQVSTIKDISQGGCYFHNNLSFEAGEILEIQVQFPSLRVPMQFIGEVRRCESLSQDKNFPLFGIAVMFLEMDEEKKKEFIDTIIFFLKKKKKE